VLQWVKRSVSDFGGDPTRIVVVGDSGGGTLATVSARHARDWEGPPIIFQVLFYPSTNISSMDYPSYRQYGREHLLTQKAIESFRQFYLPNPSDWNSPDASPLLATDLKGMPPALIITAGCDPLRDEGEAYAHKLRDHGVEVIYRVEPHMIHAFLNLYNLFPNCSPYAEAVLGYTAGVIRTKCLESCKP
jgi:acetyl esterase